MKKLKYVLLFSWKREFKKKYVKNFFNSKFCVN